MLDVLDTGANLPVITGLEAQSSKRLKNLGMAFFRYATINEQIISKEFELARGSDARIERKNSGWAYASCPPARAPITR